MRSWTRGRAALVALAAVVVVAAATFAWSRARDRWERDVGREPVSATLPLDAVGAGRVLATRLAARLCPDAGADAFPLVDDEGAQIGFTFVPSCLAGSSEPAVAVQVTSTAARAEGTVTVLAAGRRRCLAVPGTAERHLVKAFEREGGYRCPAPGCACDVGTVLRLGRRGA